MHQVLLKRGSIVELMKNEFYYWINPDENGRDLIIITGDQQVPPTDSPGHYEVVGKMLDFVQELSMRKIITMGGYQVSELRGESRVLAAVTHEELVEYYREKLKDCNVEVVWREDEEG